MRDLAGPPRGELTWRVVEPVRRRMATVACGVVLLSIALLGVLGSVAYVLYLSVWSGRGDVKDLGLPQLLPLLVSTFTVGLLVRSGLRLSCPALLRAIPPFAIRAALWLGVLFCGVCAARVSLHLAWGGGVLGPGATLGAVAMLAMIAAQLWVLLREPEVRRTRDPEDGALL